MALVNLTSGGLSGGYQKYLSAVVPRMRRDARIGAMNVFVPPEFVEAPAFRALGAECWPRDDPWRGYPSLNRRLQEINPNVVFIPTSRHLETGTPTAIMVRNMEPLEAPFAGNPWPEKLRNLARCAASRHACRAATSVIAVSAHVKEFLVRRWGISAEKVSVIYHGVEDHAGGVSACSPVSAGALTPGRFAFTAGSIRPARGLEDAVEAVAHLKLRGIEIPLAIAGGFETAQHQYLRAMAGLAERCGVANLVVWLGHLSPVEMAWCYMNCRVSITTSRAEACPNTVLEAMSHGCLCISTKTPPMPEFYKDSCCYYDGGNAIDLANVMAELVESADGEKQRLREAALARSRAFTWDKTATQTVDMLLATSSR